MLTPTVETPPPKQARSRAKLERLLLAGRQLLAERGFEATRVIDVVERAECSVGVFYSRFADKDAFFAAVQAHFLAEVNATSAELNARASELGGVELLRAYIAHGVRTFRTNGALIRAFLQYEALHPHADQPIRAMMEERARGLVAAVARSGAVVGHPDPSVAVTIGAHVLRGALLQEALHGPNFFPLDDDALVDELVTLFTSYLQISGDPQ